MFAYTKLSNCHPLSIAGPKSGCSVVSFSCGPKPAGEAGMPTRTGSEGDTSAATLPFSVPGNATVSVARAFFLSVRGFSLGIVHAPMPWRRSAASWRARITGKAVFRPTGQLRCHMTTVPEYADRLHAFRNRSQAGLPSDQGADSLPCGGGRTVALPAPASGPVSERIILRCSGACRCTSAGSSIDPCVH